MSSLNASAPEPVAMPSAISNRASWVNLISVSGAHAVIHAYSVLLPLVYPIIQQEYHLTYTEIGLLITIPNLIGGLLQVVAGYLGRIVPRKLLIGLGNIIVGASMFLTGVTATYAGFLGWGVTRSVGGASQHPVGSAILTDSFERKRHGFALAGHVAGGNLGTLLVPSIGAALIVAIGWQHTLMVFALPGLAAGLGVLFFTREPAVAGRAEAKRARTEAGPQPLGARLRSSLAPLRHRAVLLIILASIIAAGGRGVGVLTTYVPLYLTSSLGLSKQIVATLFTLLLVGSVVGPLAAGRFSDRIGRRPMLLMSYGFAALFTLALPVVGALMGLPGLVVVIILIGLWAYAESPLLQAYLSDNVPAEEKDGAFGWYFTLAFGFGSLWGTILGKLIDVFGFGAAFWVMAGSYLLAGAILLLIPRERPAHS